VSDQPSYWKLLRDVAIAALGIFMLVHETLSAHPQEVIVGAALVLLGVPVALRLDEQRRKNGDG